MARVSLTEWAVLAALAEQPAHLFAVARLLAKDGALGRVLTLRRPLVYRAADRLAAGGLCRPDHSEPGEGGPERTVYRITAAGRRALERWLGEPVAHVRDLRTEFLLKVLLTVRAGRSPLPLVKAQQEALAPTFAALAADAGHDEVGLWRQHSAAGAKAFLAELAARFRTAPLPDVPATAAPPPSSAPA
ncbi:MAG TPA: PadR family transcriptional regulator [Acidimicrobiia bacterium]|nr:PadR family transcriptional regulator [Acidimicrobiia bacterium]